MMINSYETIIIFEPKEELAKAEIRKFKDITQDFYRHIEVKVEDIGIKKLAYEIKTNEEGYYAIFKWRGTVENVRELERQLRIDDHAIKFITVKQDDDYEIEDAEYIPDSPESEQTVAQEKPIVDVLDIIYGLAK